MTLLLARDAITSSARTRLAQRVRVGELARVARGAYVDAAVWASMDARARYLLRVRSAVAMARGPLVLCRAAAVALHDLPWLGPWPDRVDVIVEPDSPSRTSSTLVRHREPMRATVVIDGLTVTDLASTAVDVARGTDFPRAVVVADAVVRRGVSLSTAFDAIPIRHGSARVRAVIAFADARSASPGESVSRVTMRTIGVELPDLQHEFPRDGLRPWSVDFWWARAGVIGEFDGNVKYLDPEMGNGRSPADVVLDEKRREDALRRVSRGFVRWDWRVARSPRLLAERLATVGIVPRQPRTFL